MNNNIFKTDDKERPYTVSFDFDGKRVNESFTTKEMAELFVFYKINLMKDMKAFSIPLENRTTLKSMAELKLNASSLDAKSMNDISVSITFAEKFFDSSTYFSDISYDQWLSAAKAGTLDKSIFTIRKYFAALSSIVSHCQALGMNLDNIPLKVLQTFITPNLKEKAKK